MASSLAGYALLAIGLGIILVALGMAYGLYGQFKSQGSSMFASSQGTTLATSNGTQAITNALSGLTGGLTNTLSTVAGYSLQLFAIFLIASIGYKVADLGIKLNASEKEKEPS